MMMIFLMLEVPQSGTMCPATVHHQGRLLAPDSQKVLGSFSLSGFPSTCWIPCSICLCLTVSKTARDSNLPCLYAVPTERRAKLGSYILVN